MNRRQTMLKRLGPLALGLILLVFAGLSVVGITWGLPTSRIDPYLFGDAPPWPGEKIYRLAGAEDKFAPGRGADVDVDPLDRSSTTPVPLTATEEDVAKIYLRYRLYTHQPDEMITMMALAGMEPGQLNFDPRLYQYGGLFIYPVGALIRACGILGLIDVRNDLIYYLDHPEEFGKFYIVARAYAAGWGLLGVYLVFLIARRLGGSWAGRLAALLFTLMPVVVCMAHEGKPHLPGAVLMLAAVLFAMRFASCEAAGAGPVSTSLQESCKTRAWWLTCVCCGAALGMVLSSLPILVLIPMLALIDARRERTASGAERSAPQPAHFNEHAQAFGANPMRRVDQACDTPRGLKPAARHWCGIAHGHSGWVALAVKRTVTGLAVAVAVYFITNPYILINAVSNRDVLRSNFGNSLAMYEISRVAEGFVRVLELTVEGVTLPILILGTIAVVAAIARRTAGIAPLAVPAVVFFLQFVLLGAGKPAEYGRFGIFANTALVVGAACLLTHRWWKLRAAANWTVGAVVVLWAALCGGLYLMNFRVDTTIDNWRTASARFIDQCRSEPDSGGKGVRIAVLADPAPYGCPPMNFAKTNVVLLQHPDRSIDTAAEERTILIRPVDRFPWPSSNKLLAMKLLGCDVFGQPRRGTPSPVDHSPLRPVETPISWANKPIVEEALWPAGELPGGNDTRDPG